MDLKMILSNLDKKRDAGVLIELLRELVYFPSREAVLTAVKFLEHPDYLVRSRAFKTLERIQKPAAIPKLLKILGEEKDEEFRLRSLEILRQMDEPALLPDLKELLKDRDPLVVRGTLWAAGSIGGEEAAEMILNFGASPAGRILRRELVGEALGLALQKVSEPEALLNRLVGQSPQIRRYLVGLNRDPEKVRFSVYPAPDYFRLQCQKRKVDYREFKNL